MSPKVSLPVVTNADTATFECVFPSCGGQCCRMSRPPVEKAERARIQKVLPRVIGAMRPEARAHVEKNGWLTNQKYKSERPMIRIAKEYCVFYNEGCVLHRLGASEGDSTKYKPWVCIAFPVDTDPKGRWEVRQWGRPGEGWNLFCLNPKESKKKANETLAFEIDFVRALDAPKSKQRWRFKK
jgi:hypothetical protein